MQDKDYVKQNAGPQQGNIHHDSDEGINNDGHPGSTLHKTAAAKPEEDKEKSEMNAGQRKTSDDKERSERETEGNP